MAFGPGIGTPRVWCPRHGRGTRMPQSYQDFGSQSATSSSLLEGIRSRSPQAWRRFVDAFGPVVYWASRRAGLDAADAADITQEVFGAVARSISDFRRDRPGDSFRNWLWTILRNKIRDYFRRNRHRKRAEGGSAAHQRLAQIPQPADVEGECSYSDSGTVLLRRAADESLPAAWFDWVNRKVVLG